MPSASLRSRERLHLRLERRLVDGEAVRAHDHDLARRRLGREARSMTAAACFDSGLLVTSPSVVSASPSSRAITATETSTTPSQIPTVRFGRTAHARARPSVETSGVHGSSLGDDGWLRAPAIHATSTLSGWSTRWSLARASTRSRSPRWCAAAIATTWRSRVVDASPSARASRRSPCWREQRRRDEDQRIVAGVRRLDDRLDRGVVSHHESPQQLVHVRDDRGRR